MLYNSLLEYLPPRPPPPQAHCPGVYCREHRDPETAGHLYALEVKRMIEEAQSKGKKVGGSIECIVIHFTCLKSEQLGSVGWCHGASAVDSGYLNCTASVFPSILY